MVILGLSKIEQITENEIGHTLGLGNANFNDDLMSVIVSGESGSISKCDINAVIGVNRWKLMESGSIPHSPDVDHVIVKDSHLSLVSIWRNHIF